MTKDEFMFILSKEMKNLEEELEVICKQEKNFKLISNDIELKRIIIYKKYILMEKIKNLSVLVNLPAYERIQAMSDTEVDEYKNSRNREYELTINELKTKIQQEKKKLFQLKKKHEELIAKYMNASSTVEVENITHEIKKISTDIYAYSNPTGTIAKLESEVEEVKKQQKRLKTMTSKEIKEQILSKIGDNNHLEKTINDTKKSIDAFTELLASVANEPKKAQKMANLLAEYSKLVDEERKIGYLKFPKFLPQKIRKYLEEYINFGEGINKNNFYKDLEEIVKDFENVFEQERIKLYEQLTDEKVYQLINFNYDSRVSKKNVDFLHKHMDKLDVDDLKYLRNLIVQRDNLSRKIFKTKNTKKELEKQNEKIDEIYQEIYLKIFTWYYCFKSEILGISEGVELESYDSFNYSLEKLKNTIDKSKKAISELKENMLEFYMTIKQQKQNYENKKYEIVKKIIILADKKYNKVDIPYTSTDVIDNLQKIAKAMSYFHKADIIKNVQYEAQNQANIEEARLKGITVEQLLHMKEQVKSMKKMKKIS